MRRLRTGGIRPARFLHAALAATLAVALLPAVAGAQLPNIVDGLAVSHEYGFTTLSWEPVSGADEYEIERVEVGQDDLPVGAPLVVGIWRQNRNDPAEQPTFADAGFVPGGRYQWRVRAVVTNVPQPYSDPVVDDTPVAWGPEEFLSEFETTNAASWTSYENQIAWTDALADASERVRKLNLGHSVLGREVNLMVFGHPAPLGTAEEIAASPSVLIQCHVHGTERAPREACFMLMRKLAFSDDDWVVDILSNATVLFAPSINPDGHVNGTRGNATSQDLNRDHSLLRQPETFAFAEALRDYRPDVVVDGHEFGNSGTGDLPLLWPRNLNVAEEVHDEAQSLVRDFYFGVGARDGWWVVPYPIGLGQETILRNTLGLKNVVGMLLESRVPPGPTRPGEGSSNTQANRYRRAFSSLWTFVEVLNYHRQNLPAVQQAVAAGEARNRSNDGPAYLAGSRDAPGGTPPDDPPDPDQILDPAPCGYAITSLEFTAPRADGPPVDERAEAHGFRVADWDERVFITMNQRLRGLVPLLFDPDAVEGMVAGDRLDACPATADAGGPYSVDEFSTVTLDASASVDPHDDGLTFAWTVDGAGQLDDATSPTPVFAAGDGPADVTVTVEVCNDVGCTTDSAPVTVDNVAPTVDAGDDLTVFRGEEFTLAGTFTDPAGEADAPYEWTWDVAGDVTSGQADYGDTITRSHAFDEQGAYTATLTVSDNDGDSGSDAVTITVIEAAPDCTTATPSRSSLWPPNGQMVPITIDVPHPGGATVSVTVTSIFQDEPVGRTGPDGAGVGTSTAEVRADRDPTGNGRVYHIGFDADDGTGGTCSGTVNVEVPRTRSGTAVDDGPLYDSTRS